MLYISSICMYEPLAPLWHILTVCVNMRIRACMRVHSAAHNSMFLVRGTMCIVARVRRGRDLGSTVLAYGLAARLTHIARGPRHSPNNRRAVQTIETDGKTVNAQHRRIRNVARTKLFSIFGRSMRECECVHHLPTVFARTQPPLPTTSHNREHRTTRSSCGHNS